MTHCGGTRKMSVIIYQHCESASRLFSVMWQLDLIQKHPLLSTVLYVDFYERVKKGTYGHI